jgi:hypothetical protein
MLKYHKDLGFKRDDVILAQRLIEALKGKPFIFSKHCLIELLKESEAENIGRSIKDYILKWDDVFEVVTSEGRILKIGFRILFNDKDIVFILSNDKTILTAWLNNVKDGHFTLKASNYVRVK